MTNDIQQHLNQIINKPNLYYLDISNRNLNGHADLSEFASLTTLNSSNNSFESLDFLTTLPNKDKLKTLNFFGNQIKEIDFNWLFTNFPNLHSFNLEGGNPVKAINLNNLTRERFTKANKRN